MRNKGERILEDLGPQVACPSNVPGTETGKPQYAKISETINDATTMIDLDSRVDATLMFCGSVESTSGKFHIVRLVEEWS